MLYANKILRIIFLSLLLVIIIEIGFILLYKEKVVHESISYSEKEIEQIKKSEKAIDPTILQQLSTIIKSPNHKLYILQESKDEVLETSTNACVEDRRNGVLYPGKICFPFAYKVKLTDFPKDSTWKYLTEKNLKKTKVYIKENGKLKKASVYDIKKGDTIIQSEKWDPSIKFDLNNLKDFLDKQMIEFNIIIQRY